MEYYSAIKKVLGCVVTEVNFENIMLSETSQSGTKGQIWYGSIRWGA